MKKYTSKEIVRLFSDKIDDCNLISEIFYYLHFDCKIRTFIDYEQLDESIKNFYELKSEEALTKVSP